MISGTYGGQKQENHEQEQVIVKAIARDRKPHEMLKKKKVTFNIHLDLTNQQRLSALITF